MLRSILAVFSGILLSLSFPGFNIWLCAWFGFIPLFFALLNKTKFQAFILSYLSGVVFWAFTVYWLVHVTLLGTVILVLYLALYFGFFGVILSRPGILNNKFSVVAIPSAWVLLEYARSHLLTGFPWALLAYSQYKNIPLIQFSDITGAWGVSFLIVMANVALFSVFLTQERRVADIAKRLSVPFLCLAVILAYGYFKISLETKAVKPQILKISLIQGNIPQSLKWKPMARSFITNKYLALSREAQETEPDLIIWPEAAVPFLLGEDRGDFKILVDAARTLKTQLLLGAVSVRNGLYYNSALLFSSEGKLAGVYDKVHLVPFGEYIPLKKLLPFLETIAPIGDIERGEDYRILRVKNSQTAKQNSLGVLICFEDLFPEISAKFIREGAEFLVNITNDAWYLRTSAAEQHLAASVFRAVESRVNLMRAANTGITGFISPSGEIISLVRDKRNNKIFIDGVLTENIRIIRHKISPYAQSGDVFIIICAILLLYGIILPLKKQ
jgi:apolipoprotein N-acyltransferase